MLFGRGKDEEWPAKHENTRKRKRPWRTKGGLPRTMPIQSASAFFRALSPGLSKKARAIELEFTLSRVPKEQFRRGTPD